MPHGTLQVLGEGEDTGEEVVVVSADNGNLIGSPKVEEGIDVTALLDSTATGTEGVVD